MLNTVVLGSEIVNILESHSEVIGITSLPSFAGISKTVDAVKKLITDNETKIKIHYEDGVEISAAIKISDKLPAATVLEELNKEIRNLLADYEINDEISINLIITSVESA